MSFGIYIHIPYCLSKCCYCDFYSNPSTQTVPEEYISSVIRRLERFDCKRPNTLYFGGGTPSLLTPAQLCRINDAAKPLSDAEITLEANPETLSLERLQGFRLAGANRLSLGVQTAMDSSLKILGRPHNTAQSRKAFRWAHQAGFDNISGDIMLALPNYTNCEFDQTLAFMKEEGAAHISAYLLKIEPGTPFFCHPPQNLPTEDQTADFYLYAVEQIANTGYQQYEISNFSLPNRQSRHNLLYWNCENYLGIGPAAHSCMGNIRYAFSRDVASFINDTAKMEQTGTCTAEDYIMLQLRLNSGLDLQALKQKYGIVFGPQTIAFLQQCQTHSLLSLSPSHIRLTPKGMLIQNSILAALLENI